MIDQAAAELADRLGLETGKNGESDADAEDGIARLTASSGLLPLYEALGRLADKELERLHMLLPLLCFGQERLLDLDSGESLFNRIAVDVGTQMRSLVDTRCGVPFRTSSGAGPNGRGRVRSGNAP